MIRSLVLCLFAIGYAVWGIGCLKGDSDLVAGDFSLRGATLSEKMTEDRDFDEPVPLVYRRGFAVPLRAYFALSLVAFVAGPAVAVFLLAARRLSRVDCWKVMGGVALPNAINLLLPTVVVGEPFEYLTRLVVVFCLVPLLVLAAAARALQPSRGRVA